MSRVVISCYDHEDNPHCGGGGAVVREIARCLSRKHEVVVVSGSFPGCRRERPEPFQRMYLPTGWAGPRGGRLLFRLLLARAARRITHDMWIESFTPPFSPSFVPLVTTQPVIAVSPRVVDLPAEPPLPGQGQYILFLGRIDVDQKGLDLLLAAIAVAKPGLPVLVAGAGRPAEERKLVRLLQQTCGPVARVGYVSGPAKEALLRDCAFLVLPSRHETFGLSALEAMAWGKPVVHFDLPRLRWMGSEAAIGVPAFDVDSLAAAIRGLATDDAQRASMGRAARKTAQRYSWAEIGERYLDIVDACLSRPYIWDEFSAGAE
jgi:glycosyltransferase involved in cell wall biosynthesis